MSEAAATRWQRDPRVLWRRSGLEVVLLPPEASECTVATGSAWHVWKYLDRPMSAEDLQAALTVELGIPEDAVADGIRLLLEMLRGCGAIVAEHS